MKTLLPIGSVVLLKNMEKRVMIQGRLQKDIKTGEQFDYCACIYPEGVQDLKTTLLFNEEDIEMLFFVGFQDVEEISYKKQLLEILRTKEDK